MLVQVIVQVTILLLPAIEGATCRLPTYALSVIIVITCACVEARGGLARAGGWRVLSLS